MQDFLIQICEAEDIQILKGVVSKYNIHMHIEYQTSQDISSIVMLMKELSSRKIQIKILKLKKRYLGRHFWEIGLGCWSKGNINITDEIGNEHLKYHRNLNDNNYYGNFIIKK